MAMSVTDSYTQSQTRLHNSVTELDTENRKINVAKARTRHEHDLEQFFDHHTLGSSTSDYSEQALIRTDPRRSAPHIILI